MSARVLVVQHEGDTGPGLVGETLTGCGLQLDVRHPYAGDVLPGDLDGHDALLVLGGSQDPYDDAATPWLPAVRALMAQALERRLPLLGICLGGEILAMVGGGRVSRSAGGEFGVQRLALSPAAAGDPVFGRLADGAPAFEWHVEEIAELPPGAVALCSSEGFAHQAFRIGDCAWGTQFHPEVLTPLAAEWVAGDDGLLPRHGVDPERMVAEVRETEPEMRTVWQGFATAWAAVVRERAGAATGG